MMVSDDNAIQKVAVIGAGTMGVGIAEVAANFGHSVLLYDVNQQQLSAALDALSERTYKRVEKGKVSQQDAQQMLNRIQQVESLEMLGMADLVVEAIIEDLNIKQQLFKQLEAICTASCIFATNTSSLSITAIAAALSQPQRLVGMHFFNPAPVMKLVEVIIGQLTENAVVETVYDLCIKWGKVPVKASSTPGFIVNRVARPFYGEPLKILQEGGSFHHIDTIMKNACGFRMGPFELMDLIGIDVNFAVSRSVYQTMFNDPRYRPSLIQSEMVAAGLLGRKTGRGFYQYQSKNLPVDETTTCQECRVESIKVTVDSSPGCWQWVIDLCQPLKNVEILYEEGFSGLQINDYRLFLSNGERASTMATRIGTKVVMMDFAFDYKAVTHIHLCASSESETPDAVISLLQQLGKQVILGCDQPGMIAMRTVSMLINEAADAVFNQVCDVDSVDNAMRFGVNYPAGLIATGKRLGWQHVASVMSALHNWFGDDRYRLSPWIRRQL